MLTDNVESVLEEIKFKHFSGEKEYWRKDFQRLWDESHVRCPLLQPVITERYAAFEIPGRKQKTR